MSRFRLRSSVVVAPHTHRSAFLACCVLAIGLWQYCTAFLVSGIHSLRSLPAVGARNEQASHVSRIPRASGYSFGLAETEALVEEVERGMRVKASADIKGKYITVLGDTEIPSKGRSYFEVKILKKPAMDAWEYIGVAEANADTTKPLTKNKNGAGFFMGASWSNSMVYTHLAKQDPAPFKKWDQIRADVAKKQMTHAYEWQLINDKFDSKVYQRSASLPRNVLDKFPKKQEEFFKNMDAALKDFTDGKIADNRGWQGEEAMIGHQPDAMPKLKQGTLIGVDVDMDKGSLSYWVNGEFVTTVRAHTGELLNIKGKKLVPAVSLFGRTGGHDYSTVMEIRSGLAPPEK